MARHLITGSSGFLGGHIVERLRRMGEDVVAIDVIDPAEHKEGVTYVQGDIVDLPLLDRTIAGVDYVHHNAALVPLTKAGDRFQEVNVQGTRNIIACCKKHGVKKLIHMSSSAIYGLPEQQPITEDTQYEPVEIYGRSKLQADQEVWKYIQEGGKACCIRPRTVIGGKSRLGIFQILFDWICDGKKIYIIGDGSNLFQFVHVDDLLDAEIKATYSDHSGRYNIGTDRYRTLREDLEALITYANTGSRVVSLPVGLTKFILQTADILGLSPLAPWHYLTYHKPFVFALTKEKRELNWQPRYSNIDALIESYNWYRANRGTLLDDGHSIHTKSVQQKLLKILRWFS